MFAPFTNDEVESIRSIVLLGQQRDDMLLSNCTSRPLIQTRSFIRRFKRLLLDSQTSIADITTTANEQYVSIINGVRVKRNNRNYHMTNATSVANLASPLLTTIQSIPVKFRTRFAKFENDGENPPPRPPPLPTRSRSVCEGLTLQEITGASQKTTKIEVIPPITSHFPRACSKACELIPGTLAAVLRDSAGPAIICRVLGSRLIDGAEHVLVAFFQKDIAPCFVQPHHLVVLKQRAPLDTSTLPDPLTVDSMLEQIMQIAQATVIDNDQQPISTDVKIQQQRQKVLFSTLTYAVQLQLLNFAANYKVPEDKLRLMFDSISKIKPPKYSSTEVIILRIKDLIEQILSHLD